MYTQFFYGWLLLYKAATLSTFYSHSFQSLLVACTLSNHKQFQLSRQILPEKAAGKVISVCFLIIGARGQGFIEFFFEKSKVFLNKVRLCSRDRADRAEKCGLRGFFPFLLTAELNFFSVALEKVMTYWDLNRK